MTVTAVPVRAVPFASVQETGSEVWLTVARLLKLRFPWLPMGKLLLVPDGVVLALAAVAAGADGLIIEVHNDPPHAKCDGQQSLTPENFDQLMGKVEAMTGLMGKTLVK